MYWPSHSQDVKPFYKRIDGAPLEPEQWLATYTDWHNMAEWPGIDKHTAAARSSMANLPNPKDKGGIIGAFCSAYSVPEAIDAFLPGIYERVTDDRYTYAEGSTTGGLELYKTTGVSDLVYAYSWHSTDPANVGHAVNAFDLVRIHKFGAGSTTVKKMLDFARTDERMSAILADARPSASEMFEDLGDDPETGADELILDRNLKTGRPLQSAKNIRAIMKYDFKDSIGLDRFKGQQMVLKNMPWPSEPAPREWADSDDAALRSYIEIKYDITSKQKVMDELQTAMQRQAFHPVRDYLRPLVWDGKKRLETLFIDYLGAANTSYTREVTKKSLVAAVARIMQPGIKFDNMLILVGMQNIGKSKIFRALGREWFNESITSFDGKDAMASLMGSWIIELGELTAFSRSEVQTIKQFLSRQDDRFRPAYGRYTITQKRQCVFFGTSNEKQFLRDRTGNRRFWPVECGKTIETRAELPKPEYIDQVWAEAKRLYEKGEKLYLPLDIEKAAQEIQSEYLEDDGKEGVIEHFLDKPVPDDWDKRTIDERRDSWRGFGFDSGAESRKRERVCAVEIWCECFDGDLKIRKRGDTKDIVQVMDNLEGWDRVGVRNCGPYGKQKCWERTPDTSEEW
jgi:hypothetical protein